MMLGLMQLKVSVIEVKFVSSIQYELVISMLVIKTVCMRVN